MQYSSWESVAMSGDDRNEEADGPPMIPAAALGYLLYPWAVRHILDNPPANDLGPK